MAETLTRRQARKLTKIKVGDIYWDCAYHPVLCTESIGDDVAGVSLFNGSEPRSCSIKHCGVSKLNAEQVAFLIKECRHNLLEVEEEKKQGYTEEVEARYAYFRRKVDESGLFPNWPN